MTPTGSLSSLRFHSRRSPKAVGELSATDNLSFRELK
jgi:hypothetical protein